MATKKQQSNRVKPQFYKETKTGKRVPDYEAEFWYYYITYGPVYEPVDLPWPETQFQPIKGRKFRSDFAFPKEKLLVEIDGGQWVAGGGRHNRDSDREKLNLCAMAGYRVMRYSGQMILADPKNVVSQVIQALKLSSFED